MSSAETVDGSLHLGWFRTGGFLVNEGGAPCASFGPRRAVSSTKTLNGWGDCRWFWWGGPVWRDGGAPSATLGPRRRILSCRFGHLVRPLIDFEVKGILQEEGRKENTSVTVRVAIVEAKYRNTEENVVVSATDRRRCVLTHWHWFGWCVCGHLVATSTGLGRVRGPSKIGCWRE